MLQFEVGLSASTFQEARGITLQMDPTRTNLLINPSFETNTTDWSGIMTRVTTDYYVGTASAKMICTAIDNQMYTSKYSAPVGVAYTGSAYVKGEVGKSIKLGVSAWDATNTYLGNKYATVTATGSWQRISVTYTTPANTTGVQVSILNAYAGAHTFYVDAVMLEQSASLGTYFDGSTPIVNGVMWSGTANASTSVIYPNWPTKIALLSMYINNSVPSNTPYSINLLGTTPLTGITQ
jgi:hypothetical protein